LLVGEGAILIQLGAGANGCNGIRVDKGSSGAQTFFFLGQAGSLLVLVATNLPGIKDPLKQRGHSRKQPPTSVSLTFRPHSNVGFWIQRKLSRRTDQPDQSCAISFCSFPRPPFFSLLSHASSASILSQETEGQEHGTYIGTSAPIHLSSTIAFLLCFYPSFTKAASGFSITRIKTPGL